MAYVYSHTRLDKNEVFYIGIGNDKNYTRAYVKSKRNYYWNNIVNKTNYEIKIIEDGLTWEQACEREKYWIKFYGRYDLKEGRLVNLTNGGEGQIGIIRGESYKLKQQAAQCGKKLSEETKQKIREAKLGKKNKPHFRHKNTEDMDTHPMTEWHSEWQGNFPTTEIDFKKM